MSPTTLPPPTSEAPAAIQATALAQNGEDQRLAEGVLRTLRATGYVSLWAVAVTVTGTRVTLQGWVPSYYLKQVAQAKALTVPGVREVCNELAVLATTPVDRPSHYSR